MNSRPSRAPRGVQVTGAGMAVPSRVVDNDELKQFVETSDEWIRSRTGIVTRHLADEHTTTASLAADAVRQALDAAALQPQDLDLLLLATMTEDMICPATACEVVREIGAIPCGAMDLNMACTGFVAGLSMAALAVQSGFYRHVAVVGADRLSSIVNWRDRRTCILFGDAAGAAIVSASEDPTQGCLYQSLHSDAEQAEALYVPRRESQIPPSLDSSVTSEPGWNGQLNTLQMNGQAVFKFAVNALRDCVNEALERTGLSADDIKMVVPHQSNIRIMQAAWKKLGFDEGRIYINIDRYGNTSAASVGLCLYELRDSGAIGEGDTVIFVAQGGGLTWGVSVWKL